MIYNFKLAATCAQQYNTVRHLEAQYDTNSNLLENLLFQFSLHMVFEGSSQNDQNGPYNFHVFYPPKKRICLLKDK